jgi:hypothetical protein
MQQKFERILPERKNNDLSEKSEGMSPFPGVKQYFG